MNSNKILIFGGGGYIGKYLCSVFDAIPITRKQCDLSERDSVKKILDQYKPDVVINCATSLNVTMHPFSHDDFNNNLNIFLNLFSLRDSFGMLINFGSGAEFDRSNSIESALEKDILRIKPKDHYGLSKNIISNICLDTPNFYTLRLFGCFHHTESQNRLFKKIINAKEPISIIDRYFDYVWLEDLYFIINHFINKKPTIKDINLVNNEKSLLSQLVDNFIKIHCLKTSVIYETGGLNYTGSSSLIDTFNFPMTGFELAVEKYRI